MGKSGWQYNTIEYNVKFYTKEEGMHALVQFGKQLYESHREGLVNYNGSQIGQCTLNTNIN